MRLTPAQRKFLSAHLRPPADDGFLSKFDAHATYDFVGRVDDLGLVEIVNSERMSWPWGWDGTRITPAGRSSLEGKIDG